MSGFLMILNIIIGIGLIGYGATSFLGILPGNKLVGLGLAIMGFSMFLSFLNGQFFWSSAVSIINQFISYAGIGVVAFGSFTGGKN